MPNRLIRSGFLDSEAVHSLSDPAECFYHRLLLAADDAGRMDGRADILRSRLFPLDSGRRVSDVERQLAETLSAGLVLRYEWQGRPYLQLTKWQRSSPCRTSKYPWTDGTFAIEWVKQDTCDGLRDFVKTSVSNAEGMPKGSEPFGPTPRVLYGDGDGYVEASQSREDSLRTYPSGREAAA